MMAKIDLLMATAGGWMQGSLTPTQGFYTSTRPSAIMAFSLLATDAAFLEQLMVQCLAQLHFDV